jgi:hypothetical protein
MEIMTLFLLSVIAVKIIAAVNDTRWLGSSGAIYRDLRQKASPDNEQAVFDLFEQTNGAHWPFGVKDYKLRRLASASSRNRRLRVTAAIFHASLFRFQRLAVIAGAYAIVGVSSGTFPLVVMAPSVHAVLLFALCLLILGTNVLLSVQAVVAYATLGDYAQSFQLYPLWRPGFVSAIRSNPLLQELRVLADKVATSIIAGAVAAYVACVSFQSFTGPYLGAVSAGSIGSWVQLFWQMIYFSTTTFVTVGYGDITPSGFAGQLVAVILELQAFAVLSVVLAALFSRRSGD